MAFPKFEVPCRALAVSKFSVVSFFHVKKPNSITLAGSELSSELVRSWFKAEIWPILWLASSELARASRFAAKFHYASWFGAGSKHVRSWLRTS